MQSLITLLRLQTKYSNGLNMMNTQQIQAILQNNIMTKGLFQRLFPTDHLPSSCDDMYVTSTDERDKPGEHWVAVYMIYA